MTGTELRALAERGSAMTNERALSLYATLSHWLRERIGQKCSCGHCHLCAYNHLSALSTENAELKRQLEWCREHHQLASRSSDTGKE